MTEYRVMHGDHMAFTLLRRVQPGDLITAKDLRWPDGTRPVSFDLIRCGTCGHLFTMPELTQAIGAAQGEVTHPITVQDAAPFAPIDAQNRLLDRVRLLELAVKELQDRRP